MQLHFEDSASELTLARSGQENWSVAVKGYLLDLLNQSIETFLIRVAMPLLKTKHFCHVQAETGSPVGRNVKDRNRSTSRSSC